MSKHSWIAGLLILSWAFVGCASRPAEQKELLVFAATSLTDALNEINTQFEEKNGPVAVSYGASQALAQQIASGAPADVFISAGKAPVDFLAEKQLLESSASNILRNKLVVVVRSDSLAQLDSLQQLNTPQVERIALVDPVLGPAGRYAKESLTSLGLWDAVQPKVIIAPDVRAVLAYVETDNADAGILYITDAKLSSTVKTLDIVPPESHSPIVYPAGVIQSSEQKKRAQEYLSFLRSEDARRIFRKYGFDPL